MRDYPISPTQYPKTKQRGDTLGYNTRQIRRSDARQKKKQNIVWRRDLKTRNQAGNAKPEANRKVAIKKGSITPRYDKRRYNWWTRKKRSPLTDNGNFRQIHIQTNNKARSKIGKQTQQPCSKTSRNPN